MILYFFKKLQLCFVTTFFFGIVIGHTSAQTASYGELEAAYLYNFVKYTKCPGNNSIFIISVLGESEIINELQRFFKEKKVAGVRMELKTIVTVEEAVQCQLIFVASEASSKLAALLKATAGKNVLIVTEDDLAKKGAPLSFFVDDERLKFRINKTALKQSGIEASEGLLKLGVAF